MAMREEVHAASRCSRTRRKPSSPANVVAVVRHDASGVGQIYGYFTGSASDIEVRNALTERLPVFMVPTRLMCVEVFPLTPNRKIDRKALPEPGAAPAPAPLSAPPEGGSDAATETSSGADIGIDEIAAIWQRVLNVSGIQPGDNFFDLGGHSLLAIEMHRTMKAELGLKSLSIADIFRAPTLGGLHGVIAKKAGGAPKRPALRAAIPDGATKTPKVAEAQPQAAPESATMSKRRALRANRITGA